MGFSLWHLVLLGVIMMVLFGPRRLPQLGKDLGEGIRSFKKGLSGDEIDVTDSTRKEKLHGTDADPRATTAEKTKDKV